MARIAFIDVTVTVSYGGIQTAVWQLARALHDLGHEVAVFGGEGGIRPDLGGRAIQVATFPYTPRERLPNLGTRFRKIAERYSFARRAREAVIAGNFDWVILTKPLDFFWPWLTLRGSLPRFALMSGGTEFFRGDRFLARRIDAWLACSHFNAWQVASRYKVFPKVMYNGVDVEQFSVRPVDPVRRRELGATSDDEVVFAYAGRVVGWKGLATAIRALAEPPLQGLPARLAIIGVGAQLPELKMLAENLNVAEQVTFHPPVPHAELPLLYAAADAGIFPSIGDEAFGITIAEAMACGKPVVASYIGGIPEVVGNEEHCGILVPPAEPVALATAMARLVSDKEFRNSAGESARRRIAHSYTWELAARRLLEGLFGNNGTAAKRTE